MADVKKINGYDIKDASAVHSVTVTPNLSSGTKIATISVDGTSKDLYCQTNTNTWRPVQANGTSIGDNTLNLKNGANVTITRSNGDVTIAATDTTYSEATTSAAGLMSSGDKTKLNGIATGAEVNQNAFANVTVGSTTIAADAKQDTLTLVAGSNVTITPDATNDKITIAATDTTYSSKSAASGGTDVSLVTTGEKYTWNNKSNLAIGTTATTAAAGNHTHTTTIAADSGTNQLTMAANTKYKLTAGGSTFIFTTPPDNNSVTGVKGDSESSYRTGQVNLTAANIGAAAASHTHSYAGSSSAGGAATSANKLNTDAGNYLNPTYFSSGVPVASAGMTVPFIVGTGSTAGTWLGSLTGLTAYSDGLLILYKPSVKGASTTTLNINSLGAKTVYLNNTSKLTTHYPANQPILLVYSTSQNSGCWMALDNYDSNSNTWRNVQVNGTEILGTGTSTGALNLKSGAGITVESDSGVVVKHSNSVTAGTAGTSSATSGSTLAVPYVTYDAQGHVTASGTHTHTVTGFLTAHQTIKQDGVTGATVNRFGTCSTAAGTAAKTVAITTGTFSLEAGAQVAVKFSNANTAGTPTLNVASTGAKNIFVNGAQITTGGNKALLAGTVIFIYDGTQYHLIGNYYDTNTQTVTGVKGNSESSYRTGNVNLTAANIGAAASSHNHAAGDINSGTLGVARGGTGNATGRAASLTVTTTAPTANNTDGVKIAVLSSEPSTKYSGWLYVITA